MLVTWGTKKWELCSVICIIFLFGFGTYSVITAIIAGHQIWWYNLALPLFGLSTLGLLLLVREGKNTLSNIVKYGFNPVAEGSEIEEDRESLRESVDKIDPDDRYYEDDSE